MSIEIRGYTPEQAIRLTQFKRAEGIARFLNEHQTELNRGISVITPDRFVGQAIDKVEAKIIRGALNGMFSEVMDLGLKEEISR